jgi:hypothetical protein
MPYAGLKAGRKETYLDRARALVRNAEAHGAILVAWGAVLIGFAWDPESIEEAIDFATALFGPESNGAGPPPEDEAWACGMAQGNIELLAPEGGASLAWGDALVQGNALARIAHPGEVLLDASLEAWRSGELLSVGGRVAIDLGRRMRAARLDQRQPWRRDAAAQIARMVESPLVGRASVVDALSSRPGTLAVLRADPGLGGTRILHEVRTSLGPGPSLMLMPSGLGAEPLGALRRAFARVAATEPIRLPPSLHAPLDHLLNADGVTLEIATELVLAHLRSGGSDRRAALLVDDAMEIDGVSREACALAASAADPNIVVVVRLDAMADLPESFASRPRGVEVELKPLGVTEAQELAWASTDGALVSDASMRWSRRGGYSPLGVLEAIAAGLATGELAWIGDTASARRRSAGRGKARAASQWVSRRAEELRPEARAVLTAIALLGGEASISMLTEVLRVVGLPVDPLGELAKLEMNRWLREPQPGWVGLLTRTHRAAVLELVHDARSRSWHRAVAETLERSVGPLVLAEAASHASRAGDGPWAAKLALAASRAASASRLEGSAMRLAAFAHAQDPNAELEIVREVAASASRDSVAADDAERATILADAARQQVISYPPVVPPEEELHPPSAKGRAAPPAMEPEPDPFRRPAIVPEAPEATPALDGAPIDFAGVEPPPPPSAPPSSLESGEDPGAVALRLSELARKALMDGDAGSLERWCNGLRATGEHETLADRMHAMAQLSHGQIAHAVRALRRARGKLDHAGPSARCQASLALAVALAHAGRPQEALLHGLDALARAREAKDSSGAQACMLFLAKLFEGVSRVDEAARLREVARATA